MILNNTNTSIEVLLAGAITSNQLQCIATWSDLPSANFESGQALTLTNSTTPVELIPACDDNTRREVKYVSVFNADSASATVTIRYNTGGVYKTIQKFALPSGYTLVYNKESGWSVYSTTGAVIGTSTTVLPDGTYGDIVVSSSGTVWTLLASITKAITGVWSFVTGNLRLFNAGSTFYARFVTAVTANRDVTFQDKDQTVAGIDDVYFNLTFGFGNLSPVDATTYYYTQLSMTGAGSSTTQANRETVVPYDCSLIGAAIEVLIVTTLGSNEDVPIVLRVNNTSDLTVKTDVKFDTTHNKYSVTGLSGNLTFGDSIQGKSIMPSFSTNPAGVYLVCTLYFKRR